MTSSRNPSFQEALPQLSGAPFLTDGGFETSLIFHQNVELPLFAAFVLLDSPDGRKAIADYYGPYLEIAAASGVGFILETPTWRASRDWGKQLGYAAHDVDRINRDAVAFMRSLKAEFAGKGPVVVSGNIGPRGDGYQPDTMMTAEAARAYHTHQVAAFAKAGADMVHAMTMTHVGEAAGIALAAQAEGVPVALSFTVETDGRLPSGQPFGEAIEETDALTGEGPVYYGLNCAHPDHFREQMAGGGAWRERVWVLRANASRLSHAELDAAEDLDDGNPHELAQDYAALR
ncbi:MAG: homocysteine S-methyltransferase family protein, partial [Pseudomonadota bacterium]